MATYLWSPGKWNGSNNFGDGSNLCTPPRSRMYNSWAGQYRKCFPDFPHTRVTFGLLTFKSIFLHHKPSMTKHFSNPRFVSMVSGGLDSRFSVLYHVKPSCFIFVLSNLLRQLPRDFKCDLSVCAIPFSSHKILPMILLLISSFLELNVGFMP